MMQLYVALRIVANVAVATVVSQTQAPRAAWAFPRTAYLEPISETISTIVTQKRGVQVWYDTFWDLHVLHAFLGRPVLDNM